MNEQQQQDLRDALQHVNEIIRVVGTVDDTQRTDARMSETSATAGRRLEFAYTRAVEAKAMIRKALAGE